MVVMEVGGGEGSAIRSLLSDEDNTFKLRAMVVDGWVLSGAKGLII